MPKSELNTSKREEKYPLNFVSEHKILCSSQLRWNNIRHWIGWTEEETLIPLFKAQLKLFLVK